MSAEGFELIPRREITRTGAFNRASSATYFGRDGLRHLAVVDEPRFQFTPVSSTYEGLLLEAEAINRCAWSNDFTQAGWSAELLDVFPAQRTGADGTLSMSKLAATADNGSHYLSYSFDVAAGQTSTIAVDVAAAELFMMRLEIASSSSGTLSSVVVDTVAAEAFDSVSTLTLTGMLGSEFSLPGFMLLGTPTDDYETSLVNSTQATILYLGNGICRIWLSATHDETETCEARIWLYQDDDGSPFVGAASPGLYASAFDIRLGTSVDRSSYIPTSGSIATRAVDINTAMMLSSAPVEDYPVWDSEETYDLSDRVIIWSSGNYLVFQSVQASNTGHTPLDESTAASAVPTWWQYVGLTNPWTMFDRSISSVTSADEGFSLALYPSGRIDTLALLNLDNARSVHVRVTHPDIGELYNSIHSLVSSDGISTLTDWFFTPRQIVNYLVLRDLPFYVGSRIDIDIAGLDTVSCGLCLVGLSNKIGGTRYGAEVGIKNYSVKETDEFGNLTLTERVFAKTGSFQIWVAADIVDRTHRLFEQYRAEPILIIAASQYGCTYIYGLYTKYSMLIQYAKYSICNVDFEGVT